MSSPIVRASPVLNSATEVVWTEQRQIELLDSLWRNYYVPPIVFAVYRDEEEEEVRCCVDGKQRLTSIQKFIDGQVSLQHLIASYPTSPLCPTISTTNNDVCIRTKYILHLSSYEVQ